MTNIVSYADATWRAPDGASPNDNGAVLRRAPLVEGHAGFHSHVIDCPPGYVLPPHSHDHAELFIVLGGSAEVGNATLRPFDTVAIDADEVYGLAAGPDGLQFMIVRAGRAALKVQK